MDVSKPSSLIDFLQKIGAKPLKTLSQNFLVDKNVLNKIISVSEIKKDDLVLEIGPGPGSLTNELLAKEAKVIAIEMDKTFANHLKQLPIEVYEDDFLKFPLTELFEKKGKKIKVIANLPYHIASPILYKLIQNQSYISSMTLMVQLEMGKRVLSPLGTKNYSALNVLIDFYYEAKLLFEVSKNSFLPMPNVKSVILGLKAKQEKKIDHKSFQSFVKNCFLQRRKKLFSTLKKSYSIEKLSLAFSSQNLNEDLRAEKLSTNDFYTLFTLLES
jgi:16S rRNA (adenine1518-N6/adenine1519-N6)-dimethyltransferase